MGVAGYLLYLGTNIDNALVLIACLAGQPHARRRAAFALVLAGALVLGLSLGLSEMLDDLGARPLNLLGLVPLTIGVFALLKKSDGDITRIAGLLPATVLTLSNSSDTLVTLVSFLAERPDAVRLPVSIGFGFGILTLVVLCALALDRLASNLRVLRWAARIGPLIMIGFGLFILFDTAGDKL